MDMSSEHPMATYAPPPRWHSNSQPQNGFVPPFSGAPPIPAGVNVPQQQWNSGMWMPNPLFNPQAARPSATWMPGGAWRQYGQQQPYPHQQQQQQQSFNPYKRQPRAPSAEYLATKLSDNPLGLTNMIPAEEIERREREQQRAEQEQQQLQNPEAQSTPWIWAPRGLDDDDESPPMSNSNGKHSATKPNSDTASASASSSSRNIYAAPAAPATQPPERPPSTQAPESFTSKGVLQPTFSINIVRTPDHYASPSPSRASHRSATPSQIYARSSSRGPSVESLTSYMSHLNTSSTLPSTTTSTITNSNTLTRHNSMPNTTNTAQSFTGEYLTDEPASMSDVLSPLVIPMTPKPASSRSGLGRHSSVPTVSLHTIPESASASDGTAPSRSHTPAPTNGSRRNSHQEPLPSPQNYSHTRSRSTSRPSSRHGSHPSSNSTSPYSVPPSNEQSPVSPTYPQSQGHSPHNAHFPYNTAAPSKNPLPPPPTELPYPSFSQIPSSTNTSPSKPMIPTNHTSPGTSNATYNIYMPPSSVPHGPHLSSTRTKAHTHPQSSGTAIHHSHGSTTFATITSSPPHSPNSISQHLDRSRSPQQQPPPTSSRRPHHHHTDPGPTTNMSSSSSSPSGSSESKKKHRSSKNKVTRRRKGFWNRRGDHVTQEGYIVYAPADMVYPSDLDDYPDGKDGGYMNETGMMTQWAKRPALHPPGGYESVVEWVNV